MARRLKVFSTPAGFVNALVAAPSQKAALEAWGVRDNLFASGGATVVTDPDLIAKAMATPGEIVRMPISSDAGFVAAAKSPPVSKADPPPTKVTATTAPATRPAPESKPRADRSFLGAAEKALAKAEAERKSGLVALDEERAAYEQRRAAKAQMLDEAVEAAQQAKKRAVSAFKAEGGV